MTALALYVGEHIHVDPWGPELTVVDVVPETERTGGLLAEAEDADGWAYFLFDLPDHVLDAVRGRKRGTSS